MDTKNYGYKDKTTTKLALIVDDGIDLTKFEPAGRYSHVEKAVRELGLRISEPEALETLCLALRWVGAFRKNQVEGVYANSENCLQVLIVGTVLRELKDVQSTVALLHASTTGKSKELRLQANKAILRRPAAVFGEALQKFMREVSREFADDSHKLFVQRFTTPPAE